MFYIYLGNSNIQPRPLFSTSIDRVLSNTSTSEESRSDNSLNQFNSVADPTSIDVQIETTTKTPVAAVPSIEITSGSPPLKSEGIPAAVDNGHAGKRTSTLTDEDSEYENDKTPLIHTGHQQNHKSEQVSNNTVFKSTDNKNQGQFVVTIKTTSQGGSPRGPGDEETPM